jgi:hypothetical protein
MRKSIAAGVLALALVLAAPAVASTPVESITGSGHVLATDFTVSVQAGPNGENPTGSLTLSGFLNFTATPTCVNLVDHAAVSGYEITSGPMTGQGFLVSGVDNGPPPAVDEIVYSGLLPAPPTACPAPGDPPPANLQQTGGGPLTSGDITITPAPALPTSKDQCKDGGWQSFGVFKNQGDCVSFVATHGKHDPNSRDIQARRHDRLRSVHRVRHRPRAD